MSMRPDDPETGEAQAHKNALCVPPATPHFYPSVFLSLIVCFSVYFPPSLRCLFLMQAAEGHSSLMFWVLVCGCQRSRQPYFLNGGVTDVNEAGWPSTSLQLHVRGKQTRLCGEVRAAAVCRNCCFSPCR